jgi:hypothetical protein
MATRVLSSAAYNKCAKVQLAASDVISPQMVAAQFKENLSG